MAFGYAREEVIGRELAVVVVPPALRERHRRGLARYLAGGESDILGARLELPAMRADGSEFPAELTVTRVDLPGPALFTGYVRDLTERRQIEEALREAQRMDAVGRLAGGIARLQQPAVGDRRVRGPRFAAPRGRRRAARAPAADRARK